MDGGSQQMAEHEDSKAGDAGQYVSQVRSVTNKDATRNQRFHGLCADSRQAAAISLKG